MPLDEHVIHLEDGRLASDTDQNKVKEIVDKAITHSDKGGIVIHFHGGLVPYRKGMEIAQKLLPVYKKKGKGYPVFFVWESGLLETLSNNFFEIAKETFFRIVWKRIESIAKRKFEQGPMDRAAFMLPAIDTDVHDQAIDKFLDDEDRSYLLDTERAVPDGLAELSEMELLTLENELLVDGQLTLEIQRISNALLEPADIENKIRSRSPRVQGSSLTLMDPKVLNTLVQRPAPGYRGIISTAKMIKAIVAIAARVISRFIQRRHHGFHATIVEEILRELYLANVGKLIWETMKQDTRDSFKNDANVYGGTTLLTALRNVINPDKPPRITLIGHSTGAVYISEFLNKASSLLPDSVKYNIIFLAPASTFQLTSETIKTYNNRIDNFRMFTMQDDYEKKDQLVKFLYPRSLLYFISGVLEDGYDVPIVGMERFYDQQHFQDTNFPSIITARDYILQSNDKTVWSVTTGHGSDGHKSKSQKHSDFDDDPITLASLEYILSVGF